MPDCINQLIKSRHSHGEKDISVYAYIGFTRKRIEMETLGCSDFEALTIFLKTCVTGTRLSSCRSCVHMNLTYVYTFVSFFLFPWLYVGVCAARVDM